MKFSGRLQIEADPRNWVKTDLNLSQGRLELVSGGDVLGSWSTAQVKAERVEGDKFQLHLGDDRLIFAADDALAFSYEALPVLAKKSVLAVAGGLRGKLRKGLAAPEVPVHADVPIYVEPAAPPGAGHLFHETDPVEEAAPTRKLRDLIQAAVKSNAAAPPAPEADLPGARLEPPEPAAPAHDFTEDQSTYHPKPRIFGAQLDPVVIPEVGDEAPESIVEESVAEMPQIPVDAPPAPPAFDLSPRFATRPSSDPVEARPSTILSETGARFQSGETLGDRHAESFRWNPDTDEASPPANQPASPRAIGSLDALVDEVKDAALTPAQIGAVTHLIRALADAIEGQAPKI
jgi:hypothetical protein